MRRPEELVDGHQFLQPVSPVLQGARVAREAAGIARAIDDASALSSAPARPTCAAAPARGGSSTTASKASSSLAVQRIAEEIAPLGRHPIAAQLARRRIERPRPPACRFRTARACRAGRTTASPTPANRSASLGASPVQAATAARIACSARLVACRKAPGGGSTVTSPSIRSGGRRVTIGSAVGTVAPAQSRQIGSCRQGRPAPAADRATGRAACADGPARRCRCRFRSPPHRPPRRRAGLDQRCPQRSQQGHRASDGRSHRSPTSTMRGTRPLVEARQHALALAAQHEVHAPPLARRADQRRLESRRLYAALLQRARDEPDLPRGVDIAPPMLQRATAAHA